MPATWRLQPPCRIAAFAGVIAVLVAVIAAFAVLASFLWPEQGLVTPQTRVYAGSIEKYEVGVPVYFQKDHFWLVRQPDDTFLALIAKDTHSGCVVPWRENFRFPISGEGPSSVGWFRDPCHGSTYDLTGACVYGPCPRGLDRYPVKVENGNIVVSVSPTGLIKGPPHGQVAPTR
jgi:Rieske Fe-S protein